MREENLFAPEVEHICVYHDDPKVTEQDKLRTDVCLVLPRVGKPKGEVGVKEVPGGKYAVFRYQGPYENLRAVYDTIYAKWIPEKGYKLGDTPGFEKYLSGAILATDKAAVVDGNVITGRGPGLTLDFALTLVEVLAGEAKRHEVASQLLVG